MPLKLPSWPQKPCVINLSPPFALLHGGVGWTKRKEEALATLRTISLKLQKQLSKTRALEFVTQAVYELEAHPLFNAGLGSKLQKDGQARLSAAIMDGQKQRMAGVANILSIRHPSQVARMLLPSHTRFLAGIEATQFAFSHGLFPESIVTPEKFQEWQKKKNGKTGTVGCVMLDQWKNTAAATSTGGRGFEIPGRMSDSASPAGNFATPWGAVSATGIGEEILDCSLASAIVLRLEDGQTLEEALRRAFLRHSRKFFGVIALSKKGEASVHATKGYLAYALITPQKICIGFTWQSSLFKA